jgi:hypothetical protein
LVTGRDEILMKIPSELLILLLPRSSQKALLKGLAVRLGKLSADIGVSQIILCSKKLLKQAVVSEVLTFQFGLLLLRELAKQILGHPFFQVRAHDYSSSSL